MYDDDRGVIVSVKALPSSRRDEISGVHGNCLKVKVTSAAEKGKANKAIASLLSKEFNVSRSAVEIVSGHLNARKRVLLKGIDKAHFCELFNSIVTG
ncbi:MAG: DUF167 domain-containing protein [Planctomycetota bacterium]|jgi:uncharacterized protein (TIGR00251 family)